MPQSGFASYLEPLQLGMELALEEVRGRRLAGDYSLELHFRDSESDPQSGITRFNELENQVSPHLYVSVLSSVGLALAPRAMDKEVAVIAAVASSPDIPLQNDYVFQFYQTAADEVEPMMRVIETNRIGSVGVLHQDDAYGRSIYRELNRRAEGVQVISSAFPVGDDDLSQEFAALTGSDAIVVAGFENACIAALEEIRRRGFEGIVLGTSTLSTRVFLDLPQAEGMYVATPYIYNPRFPLVREIAERYRLRFDREFHHNAAIGYDLVLLIAHLIADQQEISREGLRRALDREFFYPSLSGDVQKVQGNNSIRIPLLLAKIENGDRRFINY